MFTTFTFTDTSHIDELPVVNGQLTILTDANAMFYDIEDTRHQIGSTDLQNLVTTDTEQTITAIKHFAELHAEELHSLTTISGEGGDAAAGSHVEGKASFATSPDSYAHAEGHNTSASGTYSHSEGDGTVAGGIGSHAAGKSTVAEGNYSATQGVGSVASGDGSSAMGGGTCAADDYSVAIGLGNDPQVDDLFEVGNGTVFDADGNLLIEEDRTLSNAFRVTKQGVAIVESDVQTAEGVSLVELSVAVNNAESTQNKVTTIDESATDTQYPSAKAVRAYVDSQPDPMIFKGSLGEGGNIAELPSAANDNTGFTYKVITPGTYANKQADTGDTFISNGSEWILIPSGDEPSGTVSSVGISISPEYFDTTNSPVTSSGTLNIQLKSGYEIPVIAQTSEWDYAYHHAESDHARLDATNTSPSVTNGNIRINDNEIAVYTHPAGTNPHGTTKEDVGLGNVGNFKAVSTVANQELTDDEKANARANIGVTSGGSGDYLSSTNPVGSGSITMSIYGNDPEYLGDNAAAFGYDNIASGPASFAHGYGSTASGECASAQGDNVIASGQDAHADGYCTEASGMRAHAEGDCTHASGARSHSEGYLTVASGECSHVSGTCTTAKETNQFVTGRYNADNADAAFIIGNGSSDTDRTNLFEVCTDGVYHQGEKIGSAPNAVVIGEYTEEELPNTINADLLSGYGASHFAKQADIAADYDATKTYSQGSYCSAENALYRCITPVTTPEEFDSAKWELTDCGNELKELNSNLDDANDSIVQVSNKLFKFGSNNITKMASGVIHITNMTLSSDSNYVYKDFPITGFNKVVAIIPFVVQMTPNAFDSAVTPYVISNTNTTVRIGANRINTAQAIISWMIFGN